MIQKNKFIGICECGTRIEALIPKVFDIELIHIDQKQQEISKEGVIGYNLCKDHKLILTSQYNGSKFILYPCQIPEFLNQLDEEERKRLE